MTQDGKKFWGFNAELITSWPEILPASVMDRLKAFDHQCLKVKTNDLQEGLVQILKEDLQKIEKEFSSQLNSAWIRIEPNLMMKIDLHQ